MRSNGQHDRPSLRALVVINMVLLGLLAAVTFGPTAGAQVRVRGQYAMVAGRINGVDSKAVFIIDAVNQEMLVVAYNHNTKRLDGGGYRNIRADAAEILEGRSRPGN